MKRISVIFDYGSCSSFKHFSIIKSFHLCILCFNSFKDGFYASKKRQARTSLGFLKSDYRNNNDSCQTKNNFRLRRSNICIVSDILDLLLYISRYCFLAKSSKQKGYQVPLNLVKCYCVLLNSFYARSKSLPSFRNEIPRCPRSSILHSRSSL